MNFLTKALIVALSAASASAFAPSTNGPASSALHIATEGRGIASDVTAAEGSTFIENIWAVAPASTIQGKTLRTWEIVNPDTERVQVSARSTSTRPIQTNIEYWHTPTYIPLKFKCYSENGSLYPVNAVIETPKSPKTIACYNINSVEFPMQATVAEKGLTSAYDVLSKNGPGDHIQGGQVASYTLDASVNSVQVYVKTESRNMKARIELLQGPNNIKQSFELYASVGYKTPFYAVIETPGTGNVLRIVNENPLEFPLNTWVEPYKQGAPEGRMGWNTL